eukprot:6211116-Pleurochrysis_carterae.AAC.4
MIPHAVDLWELDRHKRAVAVCMQEGGHLVRGSQRDVRVGEVDEEIHLLHGALGKGERVEQHGDHRWSAPSDRAPRAHQVKPRLGGSPFGKVLLRSPVEVQQHQVSAAPKHAHQPRDSCLSLGAVSHDQVRDVHFGTPRAANTGRDLGLARALSERLCSYARLAGIV